MILLGALGKVINLCGCTSICELLTGHIVGSNDPQTHTHGSQLTSPYVSMAETTTKTMSVSPEVSKSRSCPGLDTADSHKNNGDSPLNVEEGQDTKLLFSGGIVKSLLSLLRTKLTRETWKKHPTAKHALVWTLRQLKVYIKR